MTEALSSFGTFLKRGDGGGPEVFALIAEVLDITGPSLQQRTAESTSHSSPGGWAEFIGTLKDGGEVTFTVHFLPTHLTHTGLISDLDNQVVRNFQVVFPDSANTTWLLPALVTNIAPGAPVEGKLTADIALKVSGQPTLS